MEPPLVSVALITYNHAKFIREAVAGILAQTGVNMEVVIGDDQSTDGTLDLVKQLIGNQLPLRMVDYPNKVGMNGNWHQTIAHCRGKYVAILEGDDVWTDPNKLRVQVELLEADPAAAMSFCDASVINETGDGKLYQSYLDEAGLDSDKVRYDINDLIKLNFMPTATVVFRNRIPFAVAEPYFQSPYVDWIIHMLNAEHGHILRAQGTMAGYRLHSAGVFGSADQSKRKRFNVFCLAAMYGCISDPTLRPLVLQRYLAAIDELAYHLDGAHIGTRRHRWVRRLSAMTGSTHWSKYL